MKSGYLFDELLLEVVLFVGLEKCKQTLFFTNGAATQHDRQTLQQGGLSVEALVLLIL